MKLNKRIGSIGELVGEYSKGLLYTTHTYQRDFVWSKQKQCAWIDTLLRQHVAPGIILIEKQAHMVYNPETDCFSAVHEETDASEEMTVKEVFDGKQRLETTFAFVCNKISFPNLDPDFFMNEECTFDSLRRCHQQTLENFPIEINVLDEQKFTKQELSTMFSKLQNGQPLMFGEQLNASETKIIQTIRSNNFDLLYRIHSNIRKFKRKSDLIILTLLFAREILEYPIFSEKNINEFINEKLSTKHELSDDYLSDAAEQIRTFLSLLDSKLVQVKRNFKTNPRVNSGLGLFLFDIYLTYPHKFLNIWQNILFDENFPKTGSYRSKNSFLDKRKYFEAHQDRLSLCP